MTTAELFNALFQGGNFSKHWLIKLSHPTAGTLRYINNNESVTYNNEEYIASNFDYTPPDMNGEGAELVICIIDNPELMNWVENADSNYTLQVVGILNDGEITPIHNYKHMHGTVSLGEDNNLNFTVEQDDRLNMIFTVYKYDTDSNRGNA